MSAWSHIFGLFSGGKSSYKAANRTRKQNKDWGSNNLGPNSAILDSNQTARNRAREAIRDNPHAQAGLEAYVSNLVGSGIVPRWKNSELQDLWDKWVIECDFDDCLDFCGLETLATTALISAGECFVRARYIDDPKAVVPLRLQLLESDICEDATSHTPDGNRKTLGIEFDHSGKRLSYWMYPDHPGELNQNSHHLTIPIPAREIAHLYRPTRPGQVRGMTWLATIIEKLYELERYEDAELKRKKFAASITAFITTPVETGDDLFGSDEGQDDDGNQIRGITPGGAYYGDPGEEFNLSQPAEVGSTTIDWVKQQLRDISMGYGVSYEMMSGDLSDVNYTSLRFGLSQFRRKCEQIQKNILIHKFCRKIGRWFVEAAVLSGKIDIPDFWDNPEEHTPEEWRAPGWEGVDQFKDAMADMLEVRAGFATLSEKIVERGEDPRTTLERIKAERETLLEMEITLDSNPNTTQKSGELHDLQTAAIINDIA